jgi:MFS family permease
VQAGPSADRRREVPIGRRNNALRVVALAFGVGAALLGFEHGYFETLQGDVPTNGVLISAIGPPCQQATAWHACEPAFTLLPSFLVSGLLAMAIAVVVMVWAAAVAPRRHGGAALLVFVIALFLVGGGFVTLLIGVVGVVAATQIDAPLTWWQAHLRGGLAGALVRLWPWLLIAYVAWAVASWLIGAAFGELMLRLTPAVSAVTPLVLILILVSAIAHDAQRRRPAG